MENLRNTEGSLSTEPISYRVKHEGMSADLFIPHRNDDIQHGIVFFPGLPAVIGKNDLTTSLAGKGFTILQPYYSGTYDSEGIFSPTSCIEDTKKAISLLKRDNIREQFFEKDIPLEVRNITFFGHSFGGQIALLGSLNSPEVEKVAIFNPLIVRREDGTPEGDLQLTDALHVLGFIQRSYPFTYRIGSESDWLEFLQGKMKEFNIFDNLNGLTNKSILNVNGLKDERIKVDGVLQLVNAAKKAQVSCTVQNISVNNGGHSLKTLLNQEIIQEVVNFLKN